MSNLEVMYSSKTEEWATPQAFFEILNAVFHFTLDPCATPDNAKCAKFYTKEQNGLLQDWGGERVFCNPPYGKEIADWVHKCSEEAKKPDTIVVALLPARTDTRYFHEYIYRKAKDVQFVKGRLKFGDCKSAAPFPSMVVIF